MQQILLFVHQQFLVFILNGRIITEEKKNKNGKIIKEDRKTER